MLPALGRNGSTDNGGPLGLCGRRPVRV